jgi:DNA-binding beta-propeller fold protein YncE
MCEPENSTMIPGNDGTRINIYLSWLDCVDSFGSVDKNTRTTGGNAVKKYLVVVLLFVTVGLVAQQQPIPTLPLQSVPDVLKFPDNVYMGEAAGVAINSKGHIFVFNRGSHPIMEFDANGTFLRSIAEGLYGFVFPHFVRVDAEDNIWVIDGGSNMVIELSPQGRPLMLLGRRSEPFEVGQPIPSNGNEVFNRPTDVAFDHAGDIFVADGYGNSRVIKYDKNGKFVKSWGRRGTGPGEFNLPHSIVTDAKDHVYVADRENNRIQIFDADGNFIKQWTHVGSPWTMCVTSGPQQFIYMVDGYVNRVLKLDMDGNILGTYGETGRQLGQFINTHGLACGLHDEIYVSETRNWRVQKLVPAHR